MNLKIIELVAQKQIAKLLLSRERLISSAEQGVPFKGTIRT